jgi:hypothetical protein
MKRIRIIKDLPVMKLVGRQLGPLAEGEETELETWEAAVLERHGFAEPLQKLTPAELRKLLLAEERESELTPIPDDFYSLVAQKIRFARAAGEHEKAREIQNQVSTLMEVRIPKLVRLALSPEGAGSLPPQERFLINRLAVTLDGWIKRLNESLEKAGEEVGKNEEFRRPVRHAVGNKADIQKPGVSATELHARGTTAPG